MHVTILSAGSRGDVQPFIVLGQTLLARGHAVRLAAPPDFTDAVRRARLEPFPMRVDFQKMLAGQAGQQLMASGQNMLQTMRQGQRAMKDSLPLLVEDVWQATQDADCLVSHIGLSAAAQTAAEARQIPLVCGTLQPFAPTHAFVHPLWPLRAKLGGGYNRLTGRLMNRLTWQIFHSEVNRLRRDTLNLPAQTYADWQAALQRAPVLNAYSAHLHDRPADWFDNQHITGFWHAESNEDWQPPDALNAFLAAGEPPLCITFGSMAIPDRAATLAVLQAALGATDQHAVLIGAWDDPADDRLFVIDSCPYEWLFPRVTAVVHHGGAGTFAAVLRAGVPYVTLPFLLDQFFWGELAHRNGVAPEAIPFKRLSAKSLADAIQWAVADPAPRESLAILSPLVRREDGVVWAAQIVEETLAAPR